ncbi:MAG: diguanylate cyclase [bacterium]
MGTLLVEGKTLFPRTRNKAMPPDQSLMIDRILSLAAESGIATSLAILEVESAPAPGAESDITELHQILRKLAGLLRERMPNELLFDRWGPAGFLCLHPNSSLTETANILAKLGDLLHKHLESRISHRSPNLFIGLAGFPEHGSSRIEILRRAEEALYVARQAGKDTIQLPPTEVLHKVTVPMSTIQIERLNSLAAHEGVNAPDLIREAVDDLLRRTYENGP